MSEFISFLPIAQAVEAKILKIFQCGFEAHSGDDSSQIPIRPNEDILNYINDRYFYEDGGVYRLLKDGFTLKQLGTFSEKTGYFHIDVKLSRKIKGRRLKRSHIVWYLHHNKWPIKQLDHKDRDKTNDNIDNLREASNKINAQNTIRCSRMKIQVIKCKRKYRVECGLLGTKIHIGWHDKETATQLAYFVCAYLEHKKIGIECYV